MSLADQLLLTLGYWREYRTLFHLGVAYGVHESTAQRIVTRTEQRLLAAQALTGSGWRQQRPRWHHGHSGGRGRQRKPD
ncbi:MAG: transposase family protein [Candidatus Thiothrix singaporensis]|uniref:Transposase family protein n=1 Tax=Candidatus Thiothrix singaporensis TaxID=2799669 RepID=A0A7L6ATK6_9GAMM|nr:MAG: transposase family protein [Candidatus Thiothrix singaporensis]QLQ32441.1 MAG: transposase family protein [Candidatus Thiothrix singaporensis]